MSELHDFFKVHTVMDPDNEQSFKVRSVRFTCILRPQLVKLTSTPHIDVLPRYGVPIPRSRHTHHTHHIY